MKKIIFLICILILPQVSFSQSKLLELKGKNSISINVALLNTNSDATHGILSIFNLDLIGSISYNRWITDNIALEFNPGIIYHKSEPPRIQIGISDDKFITNVFPIFFGIRYGVMNLDNSQPYLSLNAGPVMRVVTFKAYDDSDELIYSESNYDYAAGLKAGAGIDYFVKKRIRLGVYAGYNWTNNFINRDGYSRSDYSGFDISFRSGVIF